MGGCFAFLIALPFISVGLYIIISGMAIAYFDSSLLLLKFPINIKGLSIAGCVVGSVMIIYLFILMGLPNLFCLNIFMILGYLCLVILSIAYNTKGQTDSYLGKDTWKNSIDYDFKYENKCCGWTNYTDYIDSYSGTTNVSRNYCPFDFVSGCYQVVDNYLRPRQREIFVDSIICLVFFSFGIICCYIYYCCDGCDSEWYDLLFD